jgi:hypothetical protein
MAFQYMSVDGVSGVPPSTCRGVMRLGIVSPSNHVNADCFSDLTSYDDAGQQVDGDASFAAVVSKEFL